MRVIVKGFVQWNPVYGWNDFRLLRVLNPGTLDQQAITQPTMLPGLSLPQKKTKSNLQNEGSAQHSCIYLMNYSRTMKISSSQR